MTQTQPVLVDLDDETWAHQLDGVASWLRNVRLLQSTYRKLLDDTVGQVSEPHIRDYLAGMRDAAGAHEDAIDQLYRLVGRDADTGTLRAAAGTLVAKTREAIGHLEGIAGGARGGAWRQLREVLLTNLDAISGFAVTEQLGLALGMPAVVDITHPIIHEKTQQQLLLQEYLLEMASNAILHHKDL